MLPNIVKKISFVLIVCFGAFIWLTTNSPTLSWAIGDSSKFRIPQISYSGGNSKPRPEAIVSLLAQIAKRTSVNVKRQEIDLKISDPTLFRYPMIYLAGDSGFEPFPKNELKILRNYLSFGGFLIIDDNSVKANSDFDKSVRGLISKLFPRSPMSKIPRDHSIFRSFYLINRITGRANILPYLKGVSIKGRTVLVYSSNDLGGAWSRNKLGYWNYDMVGGGETQRKSSIRLGVNIILYALTLDYKKDMVHLPIILERLRRYNSP